jgi:hypothetical protein
MNAILKSSLNETSVRSRFRIACLVVTDQCSNFSHYQLNECFQCSLRPNYLQLLIKNSMSAEWTGVVIFFNPIFNASCVKKVLLMAI